MSTPSIWRTNAFGPAAPPRIQTGGLTLFASGTGVASFDHLRWTQYPDPALSLATVARCGSTFINWTANLPANTSLGVDVSSDGVTWTDATLQNAGPLPLFNQQDPPWVDIFGSNTGMSYTNACLGYLALDTFSRANQSGWGAATDGQIWQIVVGSPTLAIASNAGTLTGTSALVTVQLGISTAGDMEVLCRVSVASTSDNTGIALRMQANGDCYRVALNSNNLKIDKCVSGVFTTLTSSAFTTNTGTKYWLRGRVQGTNLRAKVWLDGTSEPGGWTLSTTDSSISAASGFGINTLLASSGNTDTYDSFNASQVVDTTTPAGQTATATLDTTHSRLIFTGGVQALYLYNNFTRADVDLLCDMDQADLAGLVFDVGDFLDFYTVVCADASSVNGTANTITLYKIASGVQTQLAQATNIGFVRGTYHRLRAKMLAGVITVFFDGTQVLTYTDSSPLAAGQAGLYSQTGPARFYQLWIAPQGDILTGTPAGDVVTGQFLYTRARLATTDPTVTPQLLDLTTSVFDGNIGPGTVVQGGVNYANTFCDKNMDDLCKQSSTYGWWIDQNKNMMFQDRPVTPAPWIAQSTSILAASDIEHDTNLVVEVANDLYRNRQNLTNVIATGLFSDSFKGDGSRRSFTLSYPVAPNTTPIITLDGNPQSVGLKGTSNSQWYYAYNDLTVTQDTSGTIPTSSDTVVVSYTGTYKTTVTQDNTAGQTALAAIEGGSGIVEAVEDVSSRQMTLATASPYAGQLLTRYGVLGRTITFKTYRNGLAVAQILPVFIPEENLFNAQMLIVSIDITVQTVAPNTQLYGYVVTASEMPKKASWAKLLAYGIPLTSS